MSKDLNERTNAENEKNAAGTGNAGKEKYEVRGREIVGRTHAAHETRHLARKMKAVREGEFSEKEISDISKKIAAERKSLIEKYEDCCSFLGIQQVTFQQDTPDVTVDEAKKFVYLDNLEPQDLLFVSKLETHHLYGTPAPQEEHLHTGTMLLQACINQLTWALGELDAYTNADE